MARPRIRSLPTLAIGLVKLLFIHSSGDISADASQPEPLRRHRRHQATARRNLNDQIPFVNAEDFIEECTDELLSRTVIFDERITKTEFTVFLVRYCVLEGNCRQDCYRNDNVCLDAEDLIFESLNKHLRGAFETAICLMNTNPAKSCRQFLKEMGSDFGLIVDPEAIASTAYQINFLCGESAAVLQDQYLLQHTVDTVDSEAPSTSPSLYPSINETPSPTIEVQTLSPTLSPSPPPSQDGTQNPTTNPPAEGTLRPSSSPIYQETCKDDESWTFESSNGGVVGCDWVASRPTSRCTRLGIDGRLANEACPRACGTSCSPSSIPTIYPTTMRTTLAPTKISDFQTISPTREPSVRVTQDEGTQRGIENASGSEGEGLGTAGVLGIISGVALIGFCFAVLYSGGWREPGYDMNQPIPMRTPSKRGILDNMQESYQNENHKNGTPSTRDSKTS